MEHPIARIRTRLRTKATWLGDGEFTLSFSYGLAAFPQDGTSKMSW